MHMRMTLDERFAEGFEAVCKQAGVDPRMMLLKGAQEPDWMSPQELAGAAGRAVTHPIRAAAEQLGQGSVPLQAAAGKAWTTPANKQLSMLREQIALSEDPSHAGSGAKLRAQRQARAPAARPMPVPAAVPSPASVKTPTTDAERAEYFADVTKGGPGAELAGPRSTFMDRMRAGGTAAMGTMRGLGGKLSTGWHNLPEGTRNLLMYGGGGAAGLMVLWALLRARRRQAEPKYANAITPLDAEYADAFAAKCAAANVDPEQLVRSLVKQAQSPGSLLPVVAGAAAKPVSRLARAMGWMREHPWKTTGAALGAAGGVGGVAYGVNKLRAAQPQTFTDKITALLGKAKNKAVEGAEGLGGAIKEHPYIAGGIGAGAIGASIGLAALIKKLRAAKTQNKEQQPAAAEQSADAVLNI